MTQVPLYTKEVDMKNFFLPKEPKSVYLIGSLRNDKIPPLGVTLRKLGYDVFDDWHGAGPDADDHWRDYERIRGRSYADAIRGQAATSAFNLDYHNLDRCDIGVMVMPAGKSGHLELGYMLGKGKLCFILFEEVPERWDLMYRFVIEKGGDLCFDPDDLFAALKGKM